MALPRVTIEGRLVADLKFDHAANGTPYANGRVACSENRKDDQGNYIDGDKLFVSFALFKGYAESAANVEFLKGDEVIVTGELFEREFEHNGENRKSLELKWARLAKVSPKLQQNQGQSSQPRQSADPWPSPQSTAPDPWGAPAATGEPPF